MPQHYWTEEEYAALDQSEYALHIRGLISGRQDEQSSFAYRQAAVVSYIAAACALQVYCQDTVNEVSSEGQVPDAYAETLFDEHVFYGKREGASAAFSLFVDGPAEAARLDAFRQELQDFFLSHLKRVAKEVSDFDPANELKHFMLMNLEL